MRHHRRAQLDSKNVKPQREKTFRYQKLVSAAELVQSMPRLRLLAQQRGKMIVILFRIPTQRSPLPRRNIFADHPSLVPVYGNQSWRRQAEKRLTGLAQMAASSPSITVGDNGVKTFMQIPSEKWQYSKKRRHC